MLNRIGLHNKLLELADNVYFQPPANTSLEYPAIVYNIIGTDTLHSDDAIHKSFTKFGVTYMADEPDDLEDIITKLQSIRYSSFMQSTIIDGLYHIYFEITNE